MNAITHRIEKVFVEVNTGSLESANIIKNKIGRFLETNVFPKLEQTLDDFNQTGRVARIDSLNLKIATLRDDYFSTLESEIVKQFAAKIESEIGFSGRKISNDYVNENVEILPTDKNREQVFLFFLENGHLPWFGTEEEVSEFLQPSNWEKGLDNEIFFKRLTQLLKSDNRASERFVFQLDNILIKAFLLKLNPQIKNAEAHFNTLLQRLPSISRHYFFKLLFLISTTGEKRKLLLAANDFKDSLGKFIQKINEESSSMLHAHLTDLFHKTDWISDDDKEKLTDIIFAPFNIADLKKTDLKEADFLDESLKENEIELESFFEKQEGEIAVQNAGLVLIHPFLKTFFKAVDFLNEKGQIKNSAVHVAIQTLHFLATGSDDFFEGNLVFEKFLCGMPLKMSVEKESLLSEKVKAESLQLLAEVIRQWAALKNTSPEGVRQMFFQRNGKLVQKDSNFKLIVERKAQDILLDKLAWNISLVKIPWLNELLYIEW
ncbi:contractile injection system tape measure protein [Mariniphaga sp.]|uniref:contractile injection system tape measure protein n=1 Tax=Mariniphaga sp. TaxID=1954475 RepID=UPI00356B4291